MAFTAVASDAPTSLASSPGMLRRLLSAIMKAREAQAQWRLASQLRDLPRDVLLASQLRRDLPHDVLKDIGLENSDIRRLSGANSLTMFHLG
jgi:hypothetical protein